MTNIFGKNTLEELHVPPLATVGPTTRQIEELIIKHVQAATNTVAVRTGSDWNDVTYVPRDEALRLHIILASAGDAN